MTPERKAEIAEWADDEGAAAQSYVHELFDALEEAERLARGLETSFALSKLALTQSERQREEAEGKLARDARARRIAGISAGDTPEQRTAARLRDEFHAEGNRFGMMQADAEQKATFALGDEGYKQKALAEKWKLAQHLAFDAAGRVSHAFEIAEYGTAWNERLHPQDLRDREKANGAR